MLVVSHIVAMENNKLYRNLGEGILHVINVELPSSKYDTVFHIHTEKNYVLYHSST